MAHKIKKEIVFVCSMSTAHLAFYDALLTLFSFQGTLLLLPRFQRRQLFMLSRLFHRVNIIL
ncbi:hypothetical protein SRRS_16940 [Sporomusa rhizae]